MMVVLLKSSKKGISSKDVSNLGKSSATMPMNYNDLSSSMGVVQQKEVCKLSRLLFNNNSFNLLFLFG
jgi:hypothetical protein